jgi:beta-glucosidase
MQAISQHYGPYEAPLLALEAGADLLLMPMDPPGTIAAICEAVRIGRIAPERIHQSLERIWRAKGLACSPDFSASPDFSRGTGAPETCHGWEMANQAGEDRSPLERLAELAQPQALQLAQAILQDSLQTRLSLSPNPPNDSPALTQTDPGINLILVDHLGQADFLDRPAPAIEIPQKLGYQLYWLDGYTPLSKLDLGRLGSTGSDPLEQRPLLLQLFSRGNPFRGLAGWGDWLHRWLEILSQEDRLQGFILYGSPYEWEGYLACLATHVPAVFSYGQMAMAQQVALKALFGSAAIDSTTIDSTAMGQDGKTKDYRFTT